jgi:hypothetical protein
VFGACGTSEDHKKGLERVFKAREEALGETTTLMRVEVRHRIDTGRKAFSALIFDVAFVAPLNHFDYVVQHVHGQAIQMVALDANLPFETMESISFPLALNEPVTIGGKECPMFPLAQPLYITLKAVNGRERMLVNHVDGLWVFEFAVLVEPFVMPVQ